MRLNLISLVSLGMTAALGCAANGNDAPGTNDSTALGGDDGGLTQARKRYDGGTPPNGDGGYRPGDDAGAPPPPDSGARSTPDSGSVGVGGTSPSIGGCAVFPANDPWNTRIDDPVAYPLDPNAAAYAAEMDPGQTVHPDWGDWTTDHYGIPWEVVPSTQAEVPITFTQGSDQSDLGPYPLPASARIEGGASDLGDDQHVLVLQSGTCELYELYQGAFLNPGWRCTSAAKFNLGSNTLRPDGWTSTDAAGLPILPGLVKVSEVLAGSIQHALRFTMAHTQQGYIHPATHAAGSSNKSYPPMGLRVRLKASFDTSSFTGPTLVVMTAMKQYGLLLADNGSNWYVTGDSDDAWIPLMDGLVSGLGTIQGSDFEAVYTGPISTAGL